VAASALAKPKPCSSATTPLLTAQCLSRRDRVARVILAGRQRGLRGYGNRREPVGDGLSDLVGRVLLKEVPSADGYFALRMPGADKIAERPRHAAWVPVHEELGYAAVGQPLGVAVLDLRHVRGFAVKWILVRPGQCRAPVFAGIGERPPVLGQFLPGKGWPIS
jgi:hypothetical protein